MALRAVVLRAIEVVVLVVIGFIVLDVLLRLLGANPANDLVAFIQGVSGQLVAPFEGIFGQQSFLLTALIAALVYSLVAAVASAVARMLPAEPPPEYEEYAPRRRWSWRRYRR